MQAVPYCDEERLIHSFRRICTDCLENRPGKEEAEREAAGIRLLTQEEYRTNDRAEICPQCQESDYTPGKCIVESVQIVQDRWCNRCGLAFTAVFRIAGYLREGHAVEDAQALQDVWCVDLNAQRGGERL